jgi:hypothetical protein
MYKVAHSKVHGAQIQKLSKLPVKAPEKAFRLAQSFLHRSFWMNFSHL